MNNKDVEWIKVASNIKHEQFKASLTDFIKNPLSLHIFFSYNESNVTYLISPYNVELYPKDFLENVDNLFYWMIKNEIPK